MPPDAVLRAGITLPCSSPRSARSKFAKLLRHVDPDADHAFGFEGVFLRPGATVSDAQLHPSPDYPETPILLEYARGPAYGIPGHKRCDSIYILWRYDHHSNEWREIGRAVSVAWEWAIELRPLATRALREARSCSDSLQVEVMPDIPAIAGRITVFLDRELTTLEAPQRMKVLGVLHDVFAARLCA